MGGLPVEAGFDGDDVARRLRRHLGLDPDTGVPISSASAEEASGLVKQYVGGAYTGAAFDLYGHNDPFAIASDDLVAVTLLSISVNEHSTSGIRPSAILKIDAQSGRIAALLSQLPPARDLHSLNADDFDAWLDPPTRCTRYCGRRFHYRASRRTSCWPASVRSCSRSATPSLRKPSA